MNDNEREKVKRFMNDMVTNTAVRNVIRDSFLKPRDSSGKHLDVHVLAASRLALDYLDEAWKDMSRLKDEKQEESEAKGQVAL